MPTSKLIHGKSLDSLKGLGLDHAGETHFNLSVPELVEAALRRGEGTLATNGAFVAVTTPHTGRSPRDKFIVRDKTTESAVHWGKVNAPMSPATFHHLANRVTAYLQGRETFVFDGYAGSEPRYRLPIRVVSEEAWHALFATQLFIKPSREELREHEPEFTVLHAPNFKALPENDGTRSGTFICVNFSERLVLIGGTRYAGEIKKSIFSVMNYTLPERDVFPMHCSTNVGKNGETAIFFGLSGTGKTTLSADDDRKLIGDDEHGWSPHGVFNFEGGCYAKCIRLRKEREPQIYDAIKFGAVIENVVLDERTRMPYYDDERYTENTRCAYPLDYIDNAQHPSVGGHPSSIIFLTCDAFGVLPPISKLTPAQAMYHFLAGYTAKLAGTETGVTEPQATFSTCFGEPFLPLDPTRYARMLGDKIAKHQPSVFLVNTGWTGGPCGMGERISLRYTRRMTKAAVEGELDDVECFADPIFGLHIPKAVEGVPIEVLDPRKAWTNLGEYENKAKRLACLFAENFERFKDVDEEIRAAGPQVAPA